ncbi:MAG: PorT family protein [Prevotellaceae bacterium]|jgi:hypothetical protein|nr:PorT family protein [Prevotellaceae bacterium]
MKKVCLVILGVAFTLVLNAQVRYGVKAGGTLSNVFMSIEGQKESGNMKIGVQAGGLLEYSFSESFALQPELLYVLNGTSDKEEGVEMTMSFHNIQLPINLKYKIGADNLKFYATAGPYLGYIAAGRAKASTSANGVNASASMDIFATPLKEELQLKRFDFGVGVGLGVEISKMLIGVGYQFGLANLTGATGASLKTGTFNLSIGYFF